jgi:hypothetical protein
MPVTGHFAGTCLGELVKGVLMAADDAPGRPRRPAGRSAPWTRLRRPVPKAIIVAVLVAYAWIAAGTVPFTRNALLIVLAPGLVLGAIAYGRPPERVPPPDRMDVAGFSYWAVCVVALFEWEASAFRDNALWWHPSLTELIDPMLGARPVKAVAILIWLFSGWALVRRLPGDDYPHNHDHRLRSPALRPVHARVPRPAQGHAHTDAWRVARLRDAPPGGAAADPAWLAVARMALLLPVAAIAGASARLTA